MKRFSVFVLALFVSLSTTLKAQDKKSSGDQSSFVAPSAILNKVYTKEELEKLGKLELRNIYIECFIIATEILPYMSLHNKPGATLKEMGIPETKANLDHLKKAVSVKKQYMEAVKVTLDDVIPYSDTKNIVWSIMFFQDMITKAQNGDQ